MGHNISFLINPGTSSVGIIGYIQFHQDEKRLISFEDFMLRFDTFYSEYPKLIFDEGTTLPLA